MTMWSPERYGGIDTSHHLGDVLKKPCHTLNWCPYGELVEFFPLAEGQSERCKVYGHYCPAFYASEGLAEDPAFPLKGEGG